MEWRAVSGPNKQSDKEPVWSLLVEAGFLDIPPEDFAERIKEAKHTVIERLNELLERRNAVQERESAAYSLATLRKLETTLLQPGRQKASGE
jgi:hypothetical protein